MWRPKSVVLPSEMPKRDVGIHCEEKPAWAMASQTSGLERTKLVPPRLHTEASFRVTGSRSDLVLIFEWI